MDPQSTSTTTCSDIEVTDVSTKQSNAAAHWTEGASSLITLAIKLKNFEYIKTFFEDNNFINVPLRSSENSPGYTALHLACMQYGDKLPQILVEVCHADVNILADDGAQPIHLACVFHNHSAVQILLDAGANANAELARDLFLKFPRDGKVWCDDFGDKIKILTFAILYGNFLIAEALMIKNADLDPRSHTKVNKTLLMYAIENDSQINNAVIQKFKDLELINLRDDDGYSAAHYLLHPKKYGDYRYNGKYLFELHESTNSYTMELLIKNGADIYATIDEDPDTLLLNMAAYRSCYLMLQELLPRYERITQSRALYYATLPLGDASTTVSIDPSKNERAQWKFLEKQRRLSTEFILKDLVNRRTFGLPVPEEEKELMDELIETRSDILEIVDSYEKKFIVGSLKNHIIQFGDESINWYELILRCCDEMKLGMLVKNRIFIDAALQADMMNYGDFVWFKYLIETKIERAASSVELVDN